MWPHSCVITTKYAAYHTCLSPTTCRPVFSLSCPSPSSDDRSHMDGNCLMGVGGREGTLLWWMLGHWVIKERNHTSEIPIRMLGRAEAVTFAVLLSTLQTTLKHRHAHTYIQFTLLRNHYSFETDTAITWKARKTSLQRALASPCVCMQSCMYASKLWEYTTTSWFRP